METNFSSPVANGTISYNRDKALLLFAFGLVAFVSVIGNALVIASYARDRMIKKVPGNQFILSLAVADLYVGLVTIPFYMTMISSGKWIFAGSFCNIYILFDYAIVNVSVFMVVAISHDRYLMVTKKLGYASYQTKRRTRIVVVACWVVSVIGMGILMKSFEFTLEESSHSANLLDGVCTARILRSKLGSLLLISFEGIIPAILILYFNLVVFSCIFFRTRQFGRYTSKPTMRTISEKCSVQRVIAKSNLLRRASEARNTSTANLHIGSRHCKPDDKSCEDYGEAHSSALTMDFGKLSFISTPTIPGCYLPDVRNNKRDDEMDVGIVTQGTETRGQSDVDNERVPTLDDVTIHGFSERSPQLPIAACGSSERQGTAAPNIGTTVKVLVTSGESMMTKSPDYGQVAKPLSQSRDANNPCQTNRGPTSLEQSGVNGSREESSLREASAKGHKITNEMDAPRIHERGEMSRIRHAAVTLSALVIAFFFCWAPFSFLYIYIAAYGAESVSGPVNEICTDLVWFNSVINPFLYAATSPRFRRNFMYFLSCGFVCRHGV